LGAIAARGRSNILRESVHRSFLVFGVGFIALLAGALFFAARLPVNGPQPSPAAIDAVRVAAPAGPVYPAFELPDLDGQPRQIDEWAGKHLLLNFWATWCAPCRREIPLLKAFQDEQGDRYQVIGIAVDFVEPVQAYAEETGFNYPVLVGQEDAMAVAETSGIEFIGMPFTMIVTADGELLNAHIGEIHREDLDHMVDVITRLETGDIDRDSARAALQSL
jgi:thiol-disulfide isomerase/thioredoxin